MSNTVKVKRDLVGMRFGRLEVIGLSDKRGQRGERTVPLWECRCDCGQLTYKATDTLNNSSVSMCAQCSKEYAARRMRDKAGFVDGTQVSRLKRGKLSSANSSGARGVYYDRNSGKWRARLRFKGQLMSFGTYDSFDDAVAARNDAEEQYYKSFLESSED